MATEQVTRLKSTLKGLGVEVRRCRVQKRYMKGGGFEYGAAKALISADLTDDQIKQIHDELKYVVIAGRMIFYPVHIVEH